MSRDDAVVYPGIDWMRAPTPIAQVLIQIYRCALRITQVEIEDRKPEFLRQTLDFPDDAASEAPPARPGRHKCACQRPGKGLRFVVARRSAELRRAGNDSVEPTDYEPAFR